MTTLTGSRVLSRPWTADDAEFVFDLYSRWDVQRYLGHEPKVMENIDAAHALIGRLRARSGPVLGYWAVEATATGTPVGTVMLQHIRLSGRSEPSAEVEIGWHFHPDAWGHGYATEAAQLLLRHALAAGLNRIIAVAHVENAASRRVCLRLGMTHQGRTTRYYDAEYELFESGYIRTDLSH
ncbi:MULTISPECIES: GNAT family N-acetyltransferase [unclassified Frondihabitans]|uniref:GNAT family N-acetyltransferase n=1 Tax=unclassified Frondihabitans TaxID=2626248 RepID=UPI000F503975|nr:MULTISPECIES: GNAT family N-acetyltransferase [unclassified Frondihabitans]RPE78451.1 RimJ/RimL family protein N-acetyltransferase [Frondihabitans sp. PhB153]RPF08732.1 RimJ/RimL family protein N-acetyltransferase [Frondihabitans sp. PhB161]